MNDIVSVIRSIFGTYSPIVYNDYVTNSAGEPLLVSRVPDGLAGVDIEYLACVLLFGLCVYCLFKIIGAVISGMFK